VYTAKPVLMAAPLFDGKGTHQLTAKTYVTVATRIVVLPFYFSRFVVLFTTSHCYRTHKR